MGMVNGFPSMDGTPGIKGGICFCGSYSGEQAVAFRQPNALGTELMLP